MIGNPNPAGAPADHTRRCPGCPNRIPFTESWCDHCWTRLPYALGQPIQAAYRRDSNAYLAAVHKAREWLKTNPAEAQQPPPYTLTERLQDFSDMLAGIGRHAGHSRRQNGRCAECSCGVRVQGQLS